MTATRRAAGVWLVLVAATGTSWILATPDRSSNSAAAVLLVIAFIKVRMIGLHFMGIRQAPAPLRALFEGYVLVVLFMLLSLIIIWGGDYG